MDHDGRRARDAHGGNPNRMCLYLFAAFVLEPKEQLAVMLTKEICDTRVRYSKTKHGCDYEILMCARLRIIKHQGNKPIILEYFARCTAQGGGGSFKNGKPIGEVGYCEARVAERIHWWTDRWLRSPFFLSHLLSFSDYLHTYLSMYPPIYISISISISISLSLSLALSLSFSLSLSLSLSISLSSTYLPA